MKYKFLNIRLLTISMAVLFSTPAWSQSVTVNSNGGADFMDLSEAIAEVSTNDAEPNEVIITGGGPYEEAIIISVPITIRGESAEDRPVIALLQNLEVEGRLEHGIVNSAAVDFTLENLILIPSLFDVTRRVICIEPISDDDEFSATIRNVLITGNDGNDQPISTDGSEFVTNDEAWYFQDDGIWFLGTFGGRPAGTMNVLIEDVIVTHLEPGTTGTVDANSDGFVLGGPNTFVTLRDVSVSFCDRFGFQILTEVTATLEGTPEAPIISHNNDSAGILGFGGHFDWSYVYVIDNPVGIRVDADTNLSFEADHLVVTGCTDIGMGIFFTPAEASTFPLSNSTFYNNAQHLGFRSVGESSDLITFTVTDSIFAGDDTEEVFLTTEVPAEDPFTFSTLELSNSAVVTEGPSAITFGERVENIVETDVINANPAFISTTFGEEGFLVVTAPEYAGAGSDGSNLGGAFPYGGETDVLGWILY